MPVAEMITAPGNRRTSSRQMIAVFSSERRGFFCSFALDIPVDTDLVMDRSPYLVPLLTAMHRRREYMVVHTDTHRGRIFAAISRCLCLSLR